MKDSSAAAGSEREAFQFPEEFLQKLNELSDLLDKFRPGTGPAVALFCQDSYEKGWQAARAAAPPNERVFIGEVFDCPAQSVIEESCICKAGWGHRSFDVNYRAAAPAPPSREIDGDFLYSRNKWHMVCSSLGLDPAKSCVADVIRAVADSGASAREEKHGH